MTQLYWGSTADFVDRATLNTIVEQEIVERLDRMGDGRLSKLEDDALDFLSTHGVGDLKARTRAATAGIDAASAATRSRFERSLTAFRTALAEASSRGDRSESTTLGPAGL